MVAQAGNPPQGREKYFENREGPRGGFFFFLFFSFFFFFFFFLTPAARRPLAAAGQPPQCRSLEWPEPGPALAAGRLAGLPLALTVGRPQWKARQRVTRRQSVPRQWRGTGHCSATAGVCLLPSAALVLPLSTTVTQLGRKDI